MAQQHKIIISLSNKESGELEILDNTDEIGQDPNKYYYQLTVTTTQQSDDLAQNNKQAFAITAITDLNSQPEKAIEQYYFNDIDEASRPKYFQVLTVLTVMGLGMIIGAAVVFILSFMPAIVPIFAGGLLPALGLGAAAGALPGILLAVGRGIHEWFGFASAEQALVVDPNDREVELSKSLLEKNEEIISKFNTLMQVPNKVQPELEHDTPKPLSTADEGKNSGVDQNIPTSKEQEKQESLGLLSTETQSPIIHYKAQPELEHDTPKPLPTADEGKNSGVDQNIPTSKEQEKQESLGLLSTETPSPIIHSPKAPIENKTQFKIFFAEWVTYYKYKVKTYEYLLKSTINFPEHDMKQPVVIEFLFVEDKQKTAFSLKLTAKLLEGESLNNQVNSNKIENMFQQYPELKELFFREIDKQFENQSFKDRVDNKNDPSREGRNHGEKVKQSFKTFKDNYLKNNTLKNK